jgi:hypothetical protein
MHAATTKLKTMFYVPMHSFGGAIAATFALKTKTRVPRRAARWKAEASASKALKTTGGLAEASAHRVLYYSCCENHSLCVGHPER